MLAFHQSFHPDEPKVVDIARRFPGIYLSQNRFPAYGTTMPYAVGAALLPVKVLLIKALHRPDLFSILVWIAMRLASILCGLAAIYWIYRLGATLFDSTTAALASSFLSISFYHAMNSAVATVDVPMSALITLQLLLLAKAPRANTRDYLLIGAVSGLLLGTKFAAGPFLLMPLLAAQPGKRLERIAAYLGAVAIVFVLLHPHLFLDPGKYVHWFRNEAAAWVAPQGEPWLMVPRRLLHASVLAVGWPLVLPAFFGSFMAMGRWRRFRFSLLGCLMVYYLMWSRFVMARYIIAIAPILCLFAAVFCMALVRSRRVFLRFAGLAIGTGIWVYSLALCLCGLWLRLHDTRPLASAYLAKELKPETSLGFLTTSAKYPWTFHGWRYPWVDLSRVRETPPLENPQVLIAIGEDFQQMAKAARSGYLLPGYRWDPAGNHWWYRHDPPTPELFRLYESLSSRNSPYTLDKVFLPFFPVPIEMAPPEIRIYHKRQ